MVGGYSQGTNCLILQTNFFTLAWPAINMRYIIFGVAKLVFDKRFSLIFPVIPVLASFMFIFSFQGMVWGDYGGH